MIYGKKRDESLSDVTWGKSREAYPNYARGPGAGRLQCVKMEPQSNRAGVGRPRAPKSLFLPSLHSLICLSPSKVF